MPRQTMMTIVAYFITKNESSKNLGIMILICGILIVAGFTTVFGMQNTTKDADLTFQTFRTY